MSRVPAKQINLLYKRFFPFDQNGVNGVYLDREGGHSNILSEGFLTDHSEPSGLVLDMPLCMLARWQ